MMTFCSGFTMSGMLAASGQTDSEALDRRRRDSTLFQFTSRRLRAFIDRDHPLIRIDEQFDFVRLVALLEDRYCREYGLT